MNKAGYVLGSEEFAQEAAKPLQGPRKKPVRPKPAGSLEGLLVFLGTRGRSEGAWRFVSFGKSR